MLRRDLYLLRELVKRDFEGRYAGSLLGLVWSFVQPLWQLVLFSFVFSAVMRVPLDGQRTDSFAVFLFCGLLPWAAIQEGVLRSATAITENANLVKKLRFPSWLLVAAVVFAALLHEAIAGGVFIVLLAARGELSLTTLGWLPVAVVLQLALTLGLGALMAAVQVYFRDASHALALFFSAWFYLTPIVYPLGLVPERFRGVVEANPLTGLVSLYRHALLGGDQGLPPGLIALVATAAAALVLGGWVFSRLQPGFADEV